MKSVLIQNLSAKHISQVKRILSNISILQRIYIFSITKSNLNLAFWLYYLITGKHVSKEGFVLSNYGVWLAKRHDDKTFIFCIDAKYGNQLEQTLNSISEKTVFLDIGSNIGVFSLVAAQNPNISQIHAFEPDSDNFNYLLRNIQRNRYGKIKAHNYAISDFVGKARLSKILGHSGASQILKNDFKTECPFTLVPVINHVHLDSILKPKDEKYFVKIDVEGHENKVLKTLQRTIIFPLIQDFFIEFDESLGQVNEIEKFLLENSFIELGRRGSKTHWDAHWRRLKGIKI